MKNLLKFLAFAMLLATCTLFSFCDKDEEFTIILGCYTGQDKLYVFNVDDQRIPDVEEVTAAHEMLHVAYDRMSSTQKNSLNTLLDNQLSEISDERVLDLIQLYEESIFNSCICFPFNFMQEFE